MKIIHTYQDNHTKFIYHKQTDKYFIRTYKQGFYLLFEISKSQRKKFKLYNQLPKEINLKNIILNNDTYRIMKTKNKRLKTDLEINNKRTQTTTNRYKQFYNIANETKDKQTDINKVLINLAIRETNNILKNY